MISDLLSGETGFLVGLLLGQAVGIFLCRWLYVAGDLRRMRKAKMTTEKDSGPVSE